MTTVLGVIGGIGSGKSAVSRAFNELGALVLDADAMAHEVLAQAPIRARIAEVFGAEVLAADGQVDRPTLARAVFGSERKAQREALNAIIHPAVRQQLDAGLAAARRDAVALVVLDIPLLLESPYRNLCDYVVFVKASLSHRQARIAGRGWTADDLEQREASQTPLLEKERVANFVLVNEGDLNDLQQKVRKLHDALVDG